MFRILTALNSMQADPIVVKASELMRLGLMPSASQIKDGVVRSRFMRTREWG